MVVLSHFGPWPSGIFFSGASTAPSEVVPGRFPVAIAGHPYNIEPSLYRRSTLPLRRTDQEQADEPGESTLSTSSLWRRSQSDWSLGAGQLWLDEPESIRRRFHTSIGMDVFNDRALSLLPATEEKRTSANSNLRLQVVGTRLYVVDGNTLIFSDGSGSEQNATWTAGWTTATGLPGGNILDIASSGSHIYVLGSDNSIYRATPGTTGFTLYYNPTAVATRIWTGLGRLFMGDGRSLYEVTATPGETLIFTHPDPNYVLSSLVAAPTGVYFSGNIGANFGEIRHTWVNDAGTAFIAPVVVAELLNELVNALDTVGNNICIGTTVGFRYAPLDGLATGLDFGPAVEVGSVLDFQVESVITPDERLDTFIWFTWTSIHGTGNSGIGKIRITRFTEPRVPAYASDVYSATGGTVLCVASVGGRRYFGISTDGFFGATANKVASGTFTSGRIRYGMLDVKVFSDIRWRTAPLAGRVVVDVTMDQTASFNAGVQSHPGSVSNDYSSLGAVAAEWCEITFTLERDTVDPTLGPELRWWVLRAIPASEQTMVISVPLRLHPLEQTPLGPAKDIAFLEELEFLDALDNSKQIVKYQEGLRSYDVYVNGMDFRSDQWDRMDHGLQGICLVELHTAKHPGGN